MGPERRNVGIYADIDRRIVQHTLFMAVEYVYSMGVAGDIIEFGTMTGSSAGALALGVQASHGWSRQRKKLYLLDSFEGLPESTLPQDTESPHVKTGTWGKGVCVDLSEKQLTEYMATILPSEDIVVIKGWYRDTARHLDRTFACLHIDCDLYESTMDALVPLFTKQLVSPGAIILFDDWNCNRADPRYGERAAWRELTERFVIVSSDEGGYGVAGHKFIVHGYKS